MAFHKSLSAPYLRRVWLDRPEGMKRDIYPFSIPLFESDTFEISFEKPVTIIVGENGSGKSTLLEAIAAMAGFDSGGGGPGYRAVDNSRAREASGAELSNILRGSWLPKVTSGWFFKAETFFSVARYLDEAAEDAGAMGPDFLSHSHGEGFLRFFLERIRRKGLYLLDEPESALSPQRQLDFLRTLKSVETNGAAQIIMTTHSPILMGYPTAELIELANGLIRKTTIQETNHFRILKDFVSDPDTFFARQLSES